MRRAGLLVVVAALAACGGTAKDAAPPQATTAAQGMPPACAVAFARLERVTAALQASSSLVARSTDKKELADRIRTEQVQLERSANLLATGDVPTSLAAPTRRLVAGLRALARDFAAARAPAARGNYAAASAAMDDQAVVQRIVRASSEIVRTCRGR